MAHIILACPSGIYLWPVWLWPALQAHIYGPSSYVLLFRHIVMAHIVGLLFRFLFLAIACFRYEVAAHVGMAYIGYGLYRYGLYSYGLPFRLVEASGGRMLIDGADIASLGLRTLRSATTFFLASRSLPTANAEDLFPSEGT